MALAMAGGALSAALPSQAAPQGVAGGTAAAILALPPEAPTGVQAQVATGGVQVTWTTPPNPGGGTIIDYQVSAQPSQVRVTTGGAQTSVLVEGLAQGVEYSFVVRAKNSVDNTWGPASAPSNVIMLGSTPSSAPDAPTGVSASIDPSVPGVASVSWTAPASDGGAFLRGYRVESSPGGLRYDVEAPATSTTVTGLSSNVAYTFTVKALNDIGYSLASDPSNSVIFSDGGSAATAPAPPTGVTAVAGNGQATVSWTRPADDGGSPITGYRIAGRGVTWDMTAGASATSIVFTGLTNGETYKFKVEAINAVGYSVASEFSNEVTPSVGAGPAATAPGAPTSVRAVAGIRTARVTWATPSSTGGSAISGYRVTAQPGSAVVEVPAGTNTATFALPAGRAFSFTVRAVNTAGSSDPSAASNTVRVAGLGDFNGDGRADIITRKSNGDLYLFKGNGTGGLSGYSRINSGWQYLDQILSPGDFNGDGRSDIIARKSTGELYLFTGNGTGGFTNPSYRRIGTGWQIFDRILSPGDFNGDGRADLIARRTNGDLYLYPGNGGGFNGYKKISSGWQGLDRILSPGDFNGDGKADLIARKPTGELYLFRGNGTGGVTGYSKIDSGWQGLDRISSAGDFNGDGRADIIARKPTGELYVFTGNGTGGFTSPKYRKIDSGWQYLSPLFGPGV
ncbi:fibronectin type III domain-containing protein [Knoellia sp. 3-2P3]|nr:fibronectin type III domain-containing protein [Knoellia sp. 3-2P3]